ncbi:hypothetical protein [Engelhardtia mirabilis]|uniref:Uncharacterized protein n=1 Tax=Engelhardtia mirabilis TaxID=2528011 RepID=A0A518BEI2_9BACT|nr:hypothetical protein Pla133_04640 [Planctomycetes bacterium Pla133]QDU99725.1 hypothetical protein Pla86_04640 [Planctomycetes bacterium Pla86]
MKKAYELQEADKLRPLIQSIAHELDERFMAVKRLERRLRRIEREGGDGTQSTIAVAALAEHRRNLRLSVAELELLGAEVEPGLPVTVRLPGPDGSFETGYRVSAQDGAVAEQAA